MSAIGFHLVPAAVYPAGAADVGPNFIKLGKSIALLYGANHYFPGIYPTTSLRYAITFIAFAGLATTLVAAARFLRRRSRPETTAYACYWAVSALLVALGFWLTNLGTGVGYTGGLNYLLPLVPAIGAGVGLLSARSNVGRIAAGLAIAFVGTINMVVVVNRRTQNPYGAHAYGPQIIRLLEHRGLKHGYAGYYDAQSLMWKSGLRLIIAPVHQCPVRLCKYRAFTIDSWAKARPGPTFLIVDPPQGLAFKPPPSFGRPSEVRRVGPKAVVYVFPRDLISLHVR